MHADSTTSLKRRSRGAAGARASRQPPKTIVIPSEARDPGLANATITVGTDPEEPDWLTSERSSHSALRTTRCGGRRAEKSYQQCRSCPTDIHRPTRKLEKRAKAHQKPTATHSQGTKAVNILRAVPLGKPNHAKSHIDRKEDGSEKTVPTHSYHPDPRQKTKRRPKAALQN